MVTHRYLARAIGYGMEFAMPNTALAQPAITSQGSALVAMKIAAEQANRELAVIDPIAGDKDALNRLKIQCMSLCGECPLNVCRFD